MRARAGHRDHQSELLAARKQLAGLFDFAPVPIITCDDAGIIGEVTATAAAFLGGSRQTLLGVPFFRFVAAEDRRAYGRHLARSRRRPEEVTATALHLRPPGQATPIAVRMLTRRAPNPELSGTQAWWTAIVDLTVQSQLETEISGLKRHQEAARRASEAKDLFIAVLSHELRAPLTVLLNAASVIEEAALDREDQRRVAAMVRRAANAQARLIDDLTDVTRITRGKVQLERAPTDVHAVLQETLEAFGPEVEAKGLEIVAHLEAEDRVVNGDAGRLRQVFSNLLKNAVKFTPSGGRITLRSWNHRQRLLVEVADTGIGLERGEIERLFTPFEQSSRGAGGGLGLGLAIVKGLVELHQGRIGVSSEGRGKGSRFVVDLEAIASADLATGRAMELRAAGARPAPAPKPAARILLVEDNPDIAESLALALEAEGYQVARAPTVRAALDADLDDVALVVSDIELPDGRGPDLLRRLRRRCEVPAIALSGYASNRDVAGSLAAGFAAHFRKPVDLRALLEAVRSTTEATGTIRGARGLVRTQGQGRA